MFESGDQKSHGKLETFKESNQQQNPRGLPGYYFKQSILDNFYIPFRRDSLTFSARPELRNELQYAKEKFAVFVEEKKQKTDIDENDFEIAEPLNMAAAIPVPIARSATYAITRNIGIPVLGVDMTVQTLKNTFLTVNLSYLSGEIIAQQRILKRNDIGIAFGLQYSLQRRGLRVIEGPDESFGISTVTSSLFPARIFYNHTVGLRPVIFLPLAEECTDAKSYTPY